MKVPMPTGWAHQVATKIVNENLGWEIDRTQLLRVITKSLEEAYDKGLSLGEEQGYTKLFVIMLDSLMKCAVSHNSTAKYFIDQCKEFLANLEENDNEIKDSSSLG